MGTSAAANLRILGFASRIPLPLLPRLMPVIYAALAVAVSSGVLLVVAYPAKALTNPLFYVKLTVISATFIFDTKIDIATVGSSSDDPSMGQTSAIFALVLWMAGLTAGKSLEYTYRVLTVR